ncbi:MAG: MarR family transcriptional regulator [Mycobacteriaceae bacterium]|nr:MarR family transcriptional regulator [Mycobacteriaceae bacterium]
MYSVWLSDEQQDLWRSYLAMTTRLQAAMNRQLQDDCGISLSDYDVLVALSEAGPLRPYELGDKLAWEQSRLSHQLRRMHDRGLVARHASADDRRGALVELTEDGMTALRAAAPGHAKLVRTVVFDGMTPAQRHALQKWTRAVTSRLRST